MGAFAFDVADDDADPPRRQRNHVIEVPADLGLDSLAVRLQRFGGNVVVGDGQSVEFGEFPGQQAVLEGECGVAFLFEKAGVVDCYGDPGRDRADQVAVETVVVGLVAGREPGPGQGEHA